MQINILSLVPIRSSARLAAANRPSRVRHGFTLVELLVVISIIITLAAVSLSVFLKIKSRADNIRAIDNMKEIGIAISSYLSEHDHLPTFMETGVSPAYSTTIPYSQASVLQPYLGLSEPTSKLQYAEVFHPPGLKPDNMNGRKNWYDLVCYAMYDADNFSPTKAFLPKGVMTDSEGQEVGPFGRYTASGTPSDGWRTAQLDAAMAKFSADHAGRIATLSMVPAMLEVNAQYPSAKGGWAWPVPRKALYGDHINVLYFDWRVDSVKPRYFYTE